MGVFDVAGRVFQYISAVVVPMSLAMRGCNSSFFSFEYLFFPRHQPWQPQRDSQMRLAIKAPGGHSSFSMVALCKTFE